jgi:hypothetical protein
MVKRRATSDPSVMLYLDDAERRVIATVSPMPNGYLVMGPHDTIISCGSIEEADRIASRFAFAS